MAYSRPAMASPDSSSKPYCFCLVANVAAEVFGSAGNGSAGTKHFSAGTKVYCEPPQWGDGYDNIWVVARHRGSSRLIRIIMPSERLVNWRVQAVYSATVYDQLRFPWPDKEAAATMAASMPRASHPTSSTRDVQAAGKLMTLANRRLEDGRDEYGTIEHDAMAALSTFTRDDWNRDPQGPVALQVVTQVLAESGVTLPAQAVASLIARRARRQQTSPAAAPSTTDPRER